MKEKIETENGAESATAPEALAAKDALEASTIALDARVAAFNEDLKVLLGKYNLALFAEARIFNGLIVADPKVGDAEELAKKKSELAGVAKE